jgi:Flp pilus assembly CpaE family ATPase
LGETQLAHDREVRVVLNRAPRPGRRLQDCSRAVSEWIGPAPIALLPHEPAFDRMSWEGRTLHQIAPRSKWLRELRPLVDEVIA